MRHACRCFTFALSSTRFASIFCAIRCIISSRSVIVTSPPIFAARQPSIPMPAPSSIIRRPVRGKGEEEEESREEEKEVEAEADGKRRCCDWCCCCCSMNAINAIQPSHMIDPTVSPTRSIAMIVVADVGVLVPFDCFEGQKSIRVDFACRRERRD